MNEIALKLEKAKVMMEADSIAKFQDDFDYVNRVKVIPGVERPKKKETHNVLKRALLLRQQEEQ